MHLKPIEFVLPNCKNLKRNTGKSVRGKVKEGLRTYSNIINSVANIILHTAYGKSFFKKKLAKFQNQFVKNPAGHQYGQQVLGSWLFQGIGIKVIKKIPEKLH